MQTPLKRKVSPNIEDQDFLPLKQRILHQKGNSQQQYNIHDKENLMIVGQSPNSAVIIKSDHKKKIGQTDKNESILQPLKINNQNQSNINEQQCIISIQHRQNELKELCFTIADCIVGKYQNKNILVTGNPGTGKTLTLDFLFNQFNTNFQGFFKQILSQQSYELIDQFYECIQTKMLHTITLTSTSFRNPQEIFTEIKNQVYRILNFYEKNQKNELQALKNVMQSKAANLILIVLIEEVDLLLLKAKPDIIFELFNLSTINSTNFILIGTSNSIDFASQLFEKKSIKIPFVKNLVYKQYTSIEIADILNQKIIDLQKDTPEIQKINFDQFGLKLLTKKAHSIKGSDMRFLIEICQDAMAQSKQKNLNLVTSQIIIEIFEAKTNKKSLDYLIDLPLTQQIIVASLYNNAKKKPEQSLDAEQIYKTYKFLSSQFQVECVSIQTCLEILETIKNYNLITIECKRGKQIKINNLLVRLQVSQQEIYDSLKKVECFNDFAL